MNLLPILLLLFFLLSEGNTTLSFTTDLIHRDSPLSPFYNPSITHFDRLQDAYHRSMNRVNNLKSALAPSQIDSPIVFSDLEYFMKLGIGTPPIKMVALVDTGSDLTLTQCQPTPLFYDPGRSSSYQTVPCKTESCKALDKSFCGVKDACSYNYTYADGSYSAGKLASETMTLGSSRNPVSFRSILYGCSEYKKGSKGSNNDETGGVVGLGRGKISFISQIGGSIGGRKFSYCLAPSNSTGKISFGKDSMPSGKGIVTTPILTKSSDNYTYFALEGFSVGSEKIKDFGETKAIGDYVKFVGDIIIDSGTTYTLLPKETFDNLVSVVDKVINAKKVGQRGLFANCYKDDGNINLPIITVHVKGGYFALSSLNTFSWASKDVVCLAMIWTDFPVYGNLAQTNFKVGFDLDAGTLSFQPTDCTK